MICAVVMGEVGNSSEESMEAVTELIINRVEDGRFGETVYDVLHVENQFESIHNYYDQKLPVSRECREIVRNILECSERSHDALFYSNLEYISDESTLDWFDSLEFCFQLEGQCYFK